MNAHQKNHKGTPCPVCHNNNTYRLWTAQSSQAAQHFVLQNKDSVKHVNLISHIEKLWKGKFCDILQCDDCEFCFSDPFIAGDSSFYQLAFGDKLGYPRWKWDFEITYENLILHKGKRLNLLEVGAGNGAFVQKIIADITPKNNVLCTEFSEHGRIAIEAMGVACTPKDIQEISEDRYKYFFDTICMFQVLEHMDQVDGHFEKLAWLLKKGGSLFITVPNSKRTRFLEMNGGLFDMPPNHIGSWTKKCFEAISARHGFSVVNYMTEPSSRAISLIKFALYRFLRTAQNPDSIANKITCIKNAKIRKSIQILHIALIATASIPTLFRNKSDIGESSWVHIQKN